MSASRPRRFLRSAAAVLEREWQRPLPLRCERGASLVELVVAMTVITVALVAMSGTMTLNMRQAGLAEFRSDQSAVRQYATERIRGLAFDSVAAGSTSISGITAAWTVVDSVDTKIVTLVTGGSIVTLGYAQFVEDTTTFRVPRP